MSDSRADRVDPPASREYKPVDIHGVGAIMSCPCPVANDLRDVVVAAQETAGIDVKGLARRVGVDIRRKLTIRRRQVSPSCCQGAPSSTATPSRVNRYGVVR